ncbi:hypothetical protein [Spiroplasma eriocheiris]|uniref:Uncharacterized protein n=1 Tax=Spiroplasma eriocheiris TaxID=315358 RepID=A0A0H3XHK4_9MOLU|nr:hypothetical protein [Spiroplasma eriocheiris]AKM53790.1 hypothetical protein SERIO_v1c01990 [Spiroplasma eriocheiris]
MKQGAYIMLILSCCTIGLLLIPLAWLIPMTLAAKRRIGNSESAVGLGVCSILFAGFFGLVEGILLLIPGE